MFVTLGLGQLLMIGRDLDDISPVVALMTLMVGIGFVVDAFIFRAIERNLRRKMGTDPGIVSEVLR